MGCGLAALVDVPLIGIIAIISSFGDCVPDTECHRGMDWPLGALAIGIATAIGLSARAFINWVAKRGRNGS